MIEHREGDVRANPDILGAIDVWTNGEWVTIQPMGDVVRLRAENEKLRAALIAVYRLMDMDGSDIDCCDLQGKLIEHGVVVEYTATEPCCDSCTCEEYGPEFPMKCYRLNDDLRAAAAAIRETENGR